MSSESAGPESCLDVRPKDTRSHTCIRTFTKTYVHRGSDTSEESRVTTSSPTRSTTSYSEVSRNETLYIPDRGGDVRQVDQVDVVKTGTESERVRTFEEVPTIVPLGRGTVKILTEVLPYGRNEKIYQTNILSRVLNRCYEFSTPTGPR